MNLVSKSIYSNRGIYKNTKIRPSHSHTSMWHFGLKRLKLDLYGIETWFLILTQLKIPKATTIELLVKSNSLYYLIFEMSSTFLCWIVQILWTYPQGVGLWVLLGHISKLLSAFQLYFFFIYISIKGGHSH